MNVSLNWLKKYIDIDLSPAEVGEVLTAIGLEVEGEEEVESIKGGLEGIVVGYVKECAKHPNADKLSVTKVDVGGAEDLDIVCGAPNVAKGQKVLVATVGTVLYSPEGEPWKIKKGKIRGEVSLGMICAEDELGLGNSHDGIMVLPPEVEVGTLAKDYFQLETDYVYEIGLTPNRSDATNHLGVARDLSAAMKVNHDFKGDVKIPDVSAFVPDSTNSSIEVVVENEKACPRFAGLIIKNITIKDSPKWMKTHLESIGVRSINNIVDITNFVLHELGQPLHAYDYDKIAGKKIIVKTLPQNTPFLCLDEVERKLNGEDLMICDGNGDPMCMGGVYGGLNSGVTDGTTNIFLEAAHFDAGSIRRSSMRHNLRTDAAKVFEKGSDPNMPVFALKRAAMLMKELADATIDSDIIDIHPSPIVPKEITASFSNINRLIGVEIPKEKVRFILEAMHMVILEETDTHIKVAVTTDKADVLREADLIEEILRIYGFNNVPAPGQIHTSMVVGEYPDANMVRNLTADYLSANGFYEMMAISLTESRYFKEKYHEIPEENLVYINNTSNMHLDIMRPSMVFSGLEAIVRNQNRQHPNLKMFEFGRTYQKVGEKYNEKEQLSVFLTGKRWNENWLLDSKEDVTYYTLKAFVDNVLKRVGMTSFQQKTIHTELFSLATKYHRGDSTIVDFGKISNVLLKKMDIKNDVYYAEFNWRAIYKNYKKHTMTVKDLNKFPTMRRDLALVVEKSVKFTDIARIANKIGKKMLKEVNLFDVYENEKQLGAGKKSYAVSFIFENMERTLKDKEIDKIINQLITQYETQLGALIRR